MCWYARTCVSLVVFESGWALTSEPRHGSCYLFLISPALCGFPAVTALRVETGTNEQLHPACLPGIMGLETDSGSVCAFFLHPLFVILSFPRVHLISAFWDPFSTSLIFPLIFLNILSHFFFYYPINISLLPHCLP